MAIDNSKFIYMNTIKNPLVVVAIFIAAFLGYRIFNDIFQPIDLVGAFIFGGLVYAVIYLLQKRKTGK